MCKKIVELNKIYCETNLETMSRMPSEFVDLVITSPPYNKAGYEGFIRKRHKTDIWNKGRNIEYGGDAENDFMLEQDYQKEQITFLNEVKRILKPDGSLFYNHKVRVAQHKGSHPMEWLLKTDLIFRQRIIWNRRNSPNAAPVRFLPNTELIFWLTKTARQPNFYRPKDLPFKGEVWEFSAKPNPLHPAPFPEDLPSNIIKCLKRTENVIIYDPYAGIGTTLKVADGLGYDWIGSEINPDYVDIAKDNIYSNLL